MADKIYVKQINLQHCKMATSLISRHIHVMQTKKQDLIVLIQEPWINKKIIHGFDESKMDLFYKRGTIAKPRTCIITTKGLKATFMPQFSSSDVTTVQINVRKGNVNEELILSSVYMPYEEQQNIPDNTARDAIEFSASSGIPIIIGADCNAHHIIWGSSDTNRRGELLAEYLSTTSLDIQNKGNEPTFVINRRQEVLDITLATQEFSNRIKDWIVSSEETLSDHREINFSIDCAVPPSVLFRNPRNTDWGIYSNMLKSKIHKLKCLNSMNNIDELEQAVKQITRACKSAFVCSCPGRINTPKKNHWWNKEWKNSN